MTDVKILVLSDSHRTMTYMEQAIELEKPDYVIHLGDHVRDAEDLRQLYWKLPILSVRGNCDFSSDTKEEVLTEYGDFRFLVAHGHRYGVKSGLLRYAMAAIEKQADVALFGHTHLPYCEQYHGIWMLNPGSCGSGSRPSYGMIEIESKQISCRLAFI